RDRRARAGPRPRPLIRGRHHRLQVARHGRGRRGRRRPRLPPCLGNRIRNGVDAMNGDAPAPKKRNWIAIVLGVLLLFGILGVGCVVITVSWFRQNLSVTGTSEEAAMQQLDEVRSRFPGQQPLIHLVDGRPELAAERSTEAPTQTTL